MRYLQLAMETVVGRWLWLMLLVGFTQKELLAEYIKGRILVQEFRQMTTVNVALLLRMRLCSHT
ncbi:hypothetical protein BW12_04010 [Bifidobacterium sp. UTCIF-3]|nr:hypothetical protein BW09_02015 [Bifidobacterium sp. UTCIF-1]TPF82630.1 hypothetical protein BW12_04010 [Bifidobacterium sp. UTCIF-3]TPF84771.1 hypothetical protein BW07_03280 [Bifidobacterium sp. UTCIF-36]TPF90096.1 hypothetical protein BW10_03825 [Bifidobacterium sp. UTBIF-56]TPF94781.1 hypothetical protein BW14_00920 [Bifidobacterium sp. UTBIF-68]